MILTQEALEVSQLFSFITNITKATEMKSPEPGTSSSMQLHPAPT
jgi:hypothetical protein